MHPLDWLALGLFVGGLLAVVTGLLPPASASDAMQRIAPLLGFLASVILLAELTSKAEVFDVLATRVARWGGGSYVRLFGLCVLFASATTVALNLDTTAVLLTPVMLALAVRVGIPPVPLAMTTVWLANTASLLLPASNLTNLLAANRVALSPLGLVRVMWLPELASIAVTMALLWWFFWRPRRRGETATSYTPPPDHRPGDPLLFRICAVATAGFLVTVLTGAVTLWMASTAAALLVVAAFALRRRGELRLSLIPWRLLIMVPGMFLVVETLDAHGLHQILAAAIGSDGGTAGVLRASAVGGGLSNVLNNLPVYLAGESVVPTGNHLQLLGLLVGTNVGPVITPWASLAILLWFERCRAFGVRVPLRTFMLTGTALAVGTMAAATLALTAVG
nr:SLC13 family permease [Streptacidiphilus fuscans]